MAEWPTGPDKLESMRGLVLHDGDPDNWILDRFRRYVAPSAPNDDEAIREFAFRIHWFIEGLSTSLFETLDEVEALKEEVCDLQEQLSRFGGTAEATDARASRNKWIYEQACDVDQSYFEILAALKRQCEENGWPNTVNTEQGVRVAAQRYAEKVGLAPVPKRR